MLTSIFKLIVLICLLSTSPLLAANNLNQQLFDAASNGNANSVNELLNKGADFNWKSNKNITTAMVASLNGHIDIIKIFLEKGGVRHAGSIFSMALDNNHSDIAILLLNSGLNPDTEFRLGLTLMIMAIQENNSLVVKALLQKGANIENNSMQGMTPLAHAIVGGKIKIAKELIKYGANPNHIIKSDTDNNNSSILMLAARAAHNLSLYENVKINTYYQAIKLLVNNGANVNYKFNDEGFIITALRLAAEYGNEEVVSYLLTKGAKQYPNNTSALTLLARKGDDKTILKLLSKINHANLQDSKLLLSPLWNAARHGHVSTVKLFLKYGAIVSQSPELFSAALYSKNHKNIPKIVKLLLEHKADPNQKTYNSYPLLPALSMGFFSTAELLLDYGANPNIKADSHYNNEMYYYGAETTPLIAAMMSGGLDREYSTDNYKLVKKLINKGADVNQKIKGGSTPLMVASQNSDLKTVKLLINKGAKLNEKNKKSQNALSYAVGAGGIPNDKILTLLVQKGIRDLEVTDKFGITPLMRLAKSGSEYIQLVRLLIAKGANVNARSGGDKSAILFATDAGDIKIIELLLKSGANINVIAYYNSSSYIHATPLLVVAASDKKNRAEITKLLLKYGAKIEARAGENYPTALMVAATQNHLDVINILLDAGAKLNANTYKGTALVLAAGAGNLKAVKLLIKRGADIHYKGSGNKSMALRSASTTEIAQLLKRAGASGEERELKRLAKEQSKADYAAQRKAAGWIEDDYFLCEDIKTGRRFSDIVKKLKKNHNATIEGSYFKILCDGQDILTLVLEDFERRYYFLRHLSRHFKKKLKNPTGFSKILLHETKGQNFIVKLQHLLDEGFKNKLPETDWERKPLIYLWRYTLWLRNNPIKGSEKTLMNHKLWLKKNAKHVERWKKTYNKIYHKYQL
ncbi:MAG: ankyrin repeat domain-containing protein [Colwellia sp.]|nr:ankyrin repeat domain-containing protein [Colwellia sp.]